MKDYRAALKTLRRHPDSKAAMATAMEVERFFHSSWFAVLTDIDPDYLIEKLRKEAWFAVLTDIDPDYLIERLRKEAVK